MHRRTRSLAVVEKLESRRLLSNSPTSVFISPVPFGRTPPVLAITTPASHLAAPTAGWASPALAALLLRNPKLAHRLNFLAPSIGPPTPSMTGRSAIALVRNVVTVPAPPQGTIDVASVTSGSLGESAIAPVLLVMTPEGIIPVSTTGGTTRVGLSSGVKTTAPGAAGVGSVPVSTATNRGGSVGAAVQTAGTLPDTAHLQVKGSFSPSHGSITIVVPVTPTTQALGFQVEGPSPQTDTSQPLEVDQVALVDGDGNTVAKVGPLWDPQTDGPPDAVTLALDHAPAGGSLIVQISAAAGSDAPTISGLTDLPDATGGLVPFVMDVQRLESNSLSASAAGGAANQAGNLPSANGPSIGTLSWTSTSESADSVGSTAATAQLGPDTSVSSAHVNPGQPASPGVETTASDTSHSADFSGRIALGPLASRGAAPLGPNLATVMVEPAPSVDRYERALRQDIDEHQARTAEEPSARSTPELAAGGNAAGIDNSRPGEGSGPRDTHVVAISGLGALPLKVSAIRGENRAADLDALLAALPGAHRDETGPVLARDEDRAVDSLLVSLTASTVSTAPDRRSAADYLTSACILAVGMGLTAGPLIPDLLQLIPSRSSRWRLAPGGSGRRSERSESGERRLGSWLPRRLV
jgi:hypothetical protein